MRPETGAPLDLGAYLGACAGWPRVQRLMYLMEHDAAWRVPAATEAAHLLQETWDTERFREVCTVRGTPCTPDEDAWIADTEASMQETRAVLLADLSACQVNGPREAIRRAHMALGDHYRHCGRFRDALAHYESAREYAAEHESILRAELGAMETAWDAAEPSRVLGHADHADTALDAHERVGHAPRSVRTRIHAFRTLAHWALMEPTSAPTWPEPLSEPLEAYSDVLPPLSCAWYAVLWALGAPPAQQQSRTVQLQRSAAFRAWTAHAPAPAHALSAYIRGAWTECVAHLHDAVAVWAHEPPLGAARAAACHETVLQQLIARYLGAYRRLTLQALAHVFGESALSLVIQLIEAESVHARVDIAAQTVDVLNETLSVSEVMRHVTQDVALRRRMALLQRLP
ncbi:Uncharacterized protein MSYG_4489 [Malassezia sympodialis ATCC 42132]|uniref:26S proteasome regulatory subunit Rpn7 N-terminal domain-containing protein n=1 Tax=Malassezia sympodialis (strain ATCC 42132) TaxID=1230383 RepID=A0A1M8ACL6_MALS4|nr:Uncharacterized protein MSYG_4489 [Malassezia sympodialis ATCC 42132]